MEMVELSLIDNVADNRELHRLISAHYKHTRSPLAARMLDDWDNYVGQFLKVIPVEYKKVLEAEKEAKEKESRKATAVQSA